MNSEKLKRKEEELEKQLQKELAEAMKFKEEIEKEREKALKLAEREKERQALREQKAKEREKEKIKRQKEREKEKIAEKKRLEREKIKAKEKAKKEKEQEKLRAKFEKDKASGKVAAAKPKTSSTSKAKTSAKPKAASAVSTSKKRVPSVNARAKSAKAREELQKKVAQEIKAENIVEVEEATPRLTQEVEPVVAKSTEFTFISKPKKQTEEKVELVEALVEEEKEATPQIDIKPITSSKPFPTSTEKEFKKPVEIKKEVSLSDNVDDEASILEEAKKKAGEGDLEDLRKRRMAAQEFLRAKQTETPKMTKIEPIKIDGFDLGLALESDDECSKEIMEVDNSEFTEKIEELETVNKELSEKLELLELGSQDLEVKIKKLDTINKDFETKVNELENANKEVSEKNLTLETKYVKLEAKYEALEKLSLGVQSQIDALIKQLELLKNPSKIEAVEKTVSQKDVLNAEISKNAKIIRDYLETEAEYKEKLINIQSRKEQKLISDSEYGIMKDEILYEIKVSKSERAEYEVKYEALLAELEMVDKESFCKWQAQDIVKKETKPVIVEKSTSKEEPIAKDENKQLFTDKAVVVKDDIQKIENDIRLLSVDFTLTNEKILELEEELKKQKSFENELKDSSEAMKEFQSYLFNLNKLILLVENQKVKTLKYQRDLENVSEPLGMKALKLRANIEDSLKEEKALASKKDYIENIVKDFDRYEDVKIYKRSLKDRAKMNELLKEYKEKIRTIVDQRKAKEKYLSWYKDENKKYL